MKTILALLVLALMLVVAVTAVPVFVPGVIVLTVAYVGYKVALLTL